MAEDEDDDEDAVRNALRVLHSDDEPALDDVLTLIYASHGYAVPIVPATAVEALAVRSEIAGDLANGGMDQVAWNHGHLRAHLYADALRAVGAIENADLLDRLAGQLETHRQSLGDAAAEDAVRHFLSYRRFVGGPYFQVPEFDEELAECLIEHVLDHVSELPDPEGELPRKSQ